MTIFERLLAVRDKRGGGFFLLIDPDRQVPGRIAGLTEMAGDCGVDAIMVGSSLMLTANFHEMVKEIKEHTNLPVILFPGSHSQISPQADAVLFMSLISGRNPQYLIDEQVRGAPLVREYNLEAIPTAYMLIDSGRMTSVQYLSGTLPIPADKPDIACAHALAAQYLGMRLIYLEAGSGAETPVSVALLERVAGYVELPILVGGGIRSPRDAAERIRQGASFVAIGNAFEQRAESDLLRQYAEAIHSLERIPV